MSLQRIQYVIKQMAEPREWSICLLKVKTAKKKGETTVSYYARQITLKPVGAMDEFTKRMSAIYLGVENKAGKLSNFVDVRDYDGTAEETCIYKLRDGDQLVENEFQSLKNALADYIVDNNNPLDFDASAYVLRTSMCVDSDEVPVLFFSMQNPICVLKNKYLYDNDAFEQIGHKVLNLRPTSDVIIVDDTIYLLTMAGENLFNMEHSYKLVCGSRVEEICDSGILSDNEEFSRIAKSGRNPRRFVAFNSGRFEMMKDMETRKRMAEKFRIPLTPDGKIDTGAKDAAENLVRVLCNKGMIDPFEDAPVGVSSVTKW